MPANYEQFKDEYNALLNTSWKLESSYTYYSTKVQDNINSGRSEWQTLLPLVVSFSDQCVSLYKDESIRSLALYISSVTGPGEWEFNSEGQLVLMSSYHYGNPGHLTIGQIAGLTNFLPNNSIIDELTSTKLVLGSYINGELSCRNTFSRVYGYIPDNSGNNSGNNSDPAVEKPEIGLEDYSTTTSSITLKYRIYNQDVAKVTSAKGYYGTSSPSKSVTATVAGSLITIRINSLQKGTNYYVKCSATGKSGTTMSEITKLSTLY